MYSDTHAVPRRIHGRVGVISDGCYYNRDFPVFTRSVMPWLYETCSVYYCEVEEAVTSQCVFDYSLPRVAESVDVVKRPFTLC